MKTNNIVAAPQVHNVSSAFEIWRATYMGSRKDFYDFMTTPTIERERFITSLGERAAVKAYSSVAAITII